MKFDIYQVDAFADDVFKGNPAAVVPLEAWLPAELMQSIAQENNLSETAFLVPVENAYEIRWFTPAVEVDFCGHATVAAAKIVFTALEPNSSAVNFKSASGPIVVKRQGEQMALNGPAIRSECVTVGDDVIECLGVEPLQAYGSSVQDIVLVLPRQEDVLRQSALLSSKMDPQYRGVVVTAEGDDVDFVSRFFGIDIGVDEDPVTGSAHCQLVPIWADRLGRTNFVAEQLSARGGRINCVLEGDRVTLMANAVVYMKGQIFI